MGRRFPTSSAGCPVAASGSPRRGKRWAARSPARPLRAVSNAMSGSHADLVERHRAFDRAGRARCAGDLPQGGKRSRSVSPRSRWRSPATASPALLNAAEAAPDGTRKLAASLHRREDAADIAVIDVFTSAQLDLALGRSNVIHAALLAGPESDTFLARTARLDCFRAGPKSGPSPSRGYPAPASIDDANRPRPRRGTTA